MLFYLWRRVLSFLFVREFLLPLGLGVVLALSAMPLLMRFWEKESGLSARELGKIVRLCSFFGLVYGSVVLHPLLEVR